VTDFELSTLLGIPDAAEFDPHSLWSAWSAANRLRVPIGVDEAGQPVVLDIKESAQGGMGPHGMLIGATGSGKSELLRTLVLSLAATHSSEVLNFVLVDFKGGATFIGLDQLPQRVEPARRRCGARLHGAGELAVERGDGERDLGKAHLGHLRQDVDVAQDQRRFGHDADGMAELAQHFEDLARDAHLLLLRRAWA